MSHREGTPLSARILRNHVSIVFFVFTEFKKKATHQAGAGKIPILFWDRASQQPKIWKWMGHLGSETNDLTSHEPEQHGPERTR